MIRSAKEAKEFIYQYTKKPAEYPVSERTSLDVFSDLRKQSFCEGYIGALKGPEVMSLVQGIETIKKCLEDDPDHNSSPIPCVDHYGELLEALSQFREVIKDS